MQTATPTAFRPGDHIVYPAHGVGRVMGVEKQSVAGIDLDVFVISFEQDKMTLRVPTAKARASGMRPLASGDVVNQAMKTLQGRARIKRTMWSRRAQEYETKINSGDLVQIAEVVRDLYRASDQPEQSYSERQLFESALDRMARELAAVEKTDRDAAVQRVSASLALKKARAAAAEAAAEASEAAAGEDAEAA
jgi:CarD family transcriptional regulator